MLYVAPGLVILGYRMLDRFFELQRHGTSVRRELLAGVTTFVTMSYILFVQPAMLSQDFAGNPTGLPSDAILLATCLAAALATLIMGIYARYPIALAPGMGQNAMFVSVIMALSASGQSESWRTGLGIVFVSGILFLFLSVLRVREAILEALSPSLRSSIAVGIGLFIALIGLKNAQVVVDHPATLTALNEHGAATSDWVVFWVGFVLTAVMLTRKIPGAILWGILAAAAVAALLGKITTPSVAVGFPEAHAIFAMDLMGVFSWQCVPYVFLFLYMDVFDTMGTLVGVTEQAGLSNEGRLERAREAMMADAVGTVASACLGTSTVTSYIESAAGVEQGGRTGLTAVTVAVLFLLALPLTPLLAVLGSYAPISAPALVIVGAMMVRNVRSIDWEDASEGIPAFLILLGIPVFFSIADGIAVGLIAYPTIKLLTGKHRELRPVTIGLGVVLLGYLVAKAFSLA